jgi:hypothetical protein
MNHMNVRVYRSLYWANQGLIYAAREIDELSKQPGLPRTRLQEMQAAIEETRASINRLLAERIDQPETGRASRLVVVPFPRKNANLTPAKNKSANGHKR